MKRENLKRALIIVNEMESLEKRLGYLERCSDRTDDNKKIKLSIYYENTSTSLFDIYPPNSLADMVLPALAKQAADELKELAAELETL